MKSGMNLLYRKLQPWSWPVHMQIELTSYCNVGCPICPVGNHSIKRKPAAMAPALFERLMDEVGPYLLTMGLWGWGEPLLHPDLAEILRIASGRGITTFLSTNGQNLDDPAVQNALIDHPPTYLIVAIDGLTDETNSVFRRGAKLEPILNGTRTLARMKRARNQTFPILHHRYIAMKHNEHELPLVKQFARDNQFDICTIRSLSVIDAPDNKLYEEFVPADQEFRAYEYDVDEKLLERKDFICEKAFTFPAVFADGTVVGCEQDFNAGHPYGNLSDGRSFRDIWWGPRAAKVREIIRDNMDAFSHCRNCPFKDRPVTDCSIRYLALKEE